MSYFDLLMLFIITMCIPVVGLIMWLEDKLEEKKHDKRK